jgi:hypothetical protein
MELKGLDRLEDSSYSHAKVPPYLIIIIYIMTSARKIVFIITPSPVFCPEMANRWGIQLRTNHLDAFEMRTSTFIIFLFRWFESTDWAKNDEGEAEGRTREGGELNFVGFQQRSILFQKEPPLREPRFLPSISLR